MGKASLTGIITAITLLTALSPLRAKTLQENAAEQELAASLARIKELEQRVGELQQKRVDILKVAVKAHTRLATITEENTALRKRVEPKEDETETLRTRIQELHNEAMKAQETVDRKKRDLASLHATLEQLKVEQMEPQDALNPPPKAPAAEPRVKDRPAAVPAYDSVEAAMQNIRFDDVDFREAALPDILDFIDYAVQEKSSQPKMGFVWRGDEGPEVRITMKKEGITLGDLLKEICTLGKLTYRVDGNVVRFLPIPQ